MERVKFLMDNAHQNPLQKDEYGDTALHTAVEGGSLDVLKYFIDERNCNPACLGWHGRTPLHDATDHSRGWTPLHISCGRGGLSIVKFLTGEIEKYKPMKDLMPSLTTKEKNTPLHFAALNGHIDIVRFFITDLKCCPNIPGFCGRHPLHDAAEKGHLHIIKYLIDEQACDPLCLYGYTFFVDMEMWFVVDVDCLWLAATPRQCFEPHDYHVGSCAPHVYLMFVHP